MRFTPRRLLTSFLLVAGACRGATNPDPLVGTFLATTFESAALGQGAVNVLAQGGTLGVNVANNFVTVGTLIVPAVVNGGVTFTASLAGTVVRTDSTVRFNLPADSFVRDLTFTLTRNRLEARNQSVSGTTYDIVLTRQ
ncbi:MAG: hypothetical protein ABIV10_01730 [Gemmatimonadaceae bacterium]